MSEVTLTPVEPTPDELQYLEERIYEFNSSATDIADGEPIEQSSIALATSDACDRSTRSSRRVTLLDEHLLEAEQP